MASASAAAGDDPPLGKGAPAQLQRARRRRPAAARGGARGARARSRGGRVERRRRACRQHQELPRPRRRRPASAGASSTPLGASSSTTWALVPPMPNELTPARRGRPARRRPGAQRGVDEEGAAREVDLRIGRRGSAGWAGAAGGRSASAVLMRPATPAAASRWPMLVLTRAEGAGAWRRSRRRGEHLRQRGDLDGIAERRAGAVGLDVADRCRASTPAAPWAMAITAAWPSTLGRGVADLGGAVVVDGGAADDGVDRGRRRRGRRASRLSTTRPTPLPNDGARGASASKARQWPSGETMSPSWYR